MDAVEVIPQEHVDYLVENPDTRDFFDNRYGPGAAERVLSGPPRPSQDPAQLTLWGKIKDVARAPLHGVQQAYNEATDSLGDVAEGLEDMAMRVGEGLGLSTIHVEDEQGARWVTREQLRVEGIKREDITMRGLGRADEIGDAVDINKIDAPVTVTGQLVSGVAQFGAGYATFARFTKLTGVIGAFTNGALADAFVFDPKDKNITAVLEDFGVDMGVVGDVLATNPEDEDYINRLRNVADGAIAGGIIEALGWGIKATRAKMRGENKLAEEFLGNADEALEPVRAEARTTGQQAVAEADQVIQDTPVIMDELETLARQTPEGQLEMDLGDVPLADTTTVKMDPKVKRSMTPEEIEKIRYNATLARGLEPTDLNKRISWRSLRTASSMDEVMEEIAAVGEVMADYLAKVKGGDVQRWKTVQRQASANLTRLVKMTGRDRKEVINEFFSGFTDVTKMAGHLKAREDYVFTLGENILDLSRNLNEALKGDAASATVLKKLGMDNIFELRTTLLAQRELMTHLVAAVNADRSNIARALNAMKMSRKVNPRLAEMLANRKDLFLSADAFAKSVVNEGIDSVDENLVRAVTGSMDNLRKVLDDINHIRINALLSGPGTQIVNATSNLINSVALPTAQIIGGSVRGDFKTARHGVMTIRGMIAGFSDSVRMAGSAFYNKAGILDPFDAKIEGEDLIAKKGLLNDVISMPTRVLMMMDELFKQSQYRGRVLADADAMANARGLTGEEKSLFIKEHLKNSFDDMGAGLDEGAILQAQKTTFTEPLQGDVAKMLQNMAINHPLIRFVVPFVRTPINILSQAIQHTPAVGVLSKNMKLDLKSGDPTRIAQAYGKQFIGLGLTVSAATLASQGRVTGSGPADPEMQKAWRAAGNQPYSINLGLDEAGNTIWFDYSRMEPFSNFFSIVADMVEITNDSYGDYEERNVFQGIFLAVAENTINKTFTQGISDFIDLIGGDARSSDRALRNIAASFTPNILNQLNGDMALREVRTVIDALKAKDYRFNELDPKRSVLGEIVWRDLPKYMPIGTVHKKNDPVMQMIFDLALTDRTISTPPQRTILVPDGAGNMKKQDLSEIPYKPGQSLYDKWLERTGTIEINGRTLREELTRMMNDPDFISLASIRGGGPGTQSAAVSQTISNYRLAAREDIEPLMNLTIRSDKDRGAIIEQQIRKNRGALFPEANIPPEQSVQPRRDLFDF